MKCEGIMSDEEYGPWIEHNGSPCPNPGHIHIAEFKRPTFKVDTTDYKQINDRTLEFVVRNPNASSWTWTSGHNPIMRYRVKKPKGMVILNDLLRKVEEGHKAPVKQLEEV